MQHKHLHYLYTGIYPNIAHDFNRGFNHLSQTVNGYSQTVNGYS
jgi:hypothetical protein